MEICYFMCKILRQCSCAISLPTIINKKTTFKKKKDLFL